MCSLKLTLTGKEQKQKQKQKQATPAEYEMLTCGRYDNTFDPQPFDLAKLPNNCRWQPRRIMSESRSSRCQDFAVISWYSVCW